MKEIFYVGKNSKTKKKLSRTLLIILKKTLLFDSTKPYKTT